MDRSIEYWAHMLDEAYNKDVTESDKKKNDKSKDSDNGGSKEDNKEPKEKDEAASEKKIDAKHLIKDIMVLEPSAALKFIAKQFDSDPKAFLLKNLVPFTVYAVKNGFVKAKDIGMSVKDFSKKNKADATEIDFKTVDIDEDTMKKIYVIDDKILKKLEDFISQYKDSMKDAQKDIESAGEKLDKDIKDAGVKVEGEDLADNAMVIAGVIDKPDNKNLSKKEKQKKVESAIKTKKRAKKIMDASKKSLKKKIKVDPKIAKMSDEEISKLNAEIDKKLKGKTGSSKKNDALRNKLKNAIQKGVANDFKKSVKTQFLSSKNFKKILEKNLKAGLSAEKIEDDRVVCVSVQCKKSDFKKLLSEADESKVVDISKGSKNTDIQKLVDYIKNAIKKTFGDKEVSDFYAYRKQSSDKDGVDILYVFAGIKSEALNEASKAITSLFLTEAVFKSSLKLTDVDTPEEFEQFINDVKVKPAVVTPTPEGIAKAFRKLKKSMELTKEFKDKWMDNANYSNLITNQCTQDSQLEGIAIALKKAQATATGDAAKAIAKQLKEFQKLTEGDSIDTWIDNMKDQGLIDGDMNIADKITGVASAAKDITKGGVIDDSTIEKAVSAGGEKLANAGKNAKEMAAALKDFAPKNEDEALSLAAKLAKAGGNEQAVQDAVRNLCKDQDWFSKLDTDTQMDLKNKLYSVALHPEDVDNYISNAKDTAKNVAKAATDATVDAASDAASNIPDVPYDDLTKQIAEVGDMAKDGLDDSEIDTISNLQDKINSLTSWANDNRNSSDPLVKQKIAIIMNLNDKLNDQMNKCGEILQADEAASAAERVPDAANNSKEVAKLANNEETKQATSGFLGKFGKALKTFGQAVAVAKIAKFALNNSKALVDACGGMAMKFKENKDAIAQITVLVNNGDDADQKYADTRFGVYFSADDLKWHATNLDDRKMKIDGEQDLIKRVLDTNTGKEFKKTFAERLDSLFGGENGSTIKYFINNYKDLGIKVSDKEVLKMFDKLKNIANNYDEVKKQFA